MRRSSKQAYHRHKKGKIQRIERKWDLYTCWQYTLTVSYLIISDSRLLQDLYWSADFFSNIQSNIRRIKIHQEFPNGFRQGVVLLPFYPRSVFGKCTRLFRHDFNHFLLPTHIYSIKIFHGMPLMSGYPFPITLPS